MIASLSNALLRLAGIGLTGVVFLVCLCVAFLCLISQFTKSAHYGGASLGATRQRFHRKVLVASVWFGIISFVVCGVLIKA